MRFIRIQRHANLAQVGILRQFGAWAPEYGTGSMRSGISYSKARGRYYWWQNNGNSKVTNSFEVWSSNRLYGPWTQIYHPTSGT